MTVSSRHSSESNEKERDIVSACLIIIGDEILSGRTQDKNLRVLAERLNSVGVQLVHARVIGDDEAIIIETIQAVRERYDYIFTTGGIGPTHDDITSETIAKALGLAWEFHPEAYALLERHYAESGLVFNASRQKMAKLPRGSGLLYNPLSAAPGFVIENIFVMAGVPAIMEVMLDSALPRLSGGRVVLSRSLSCGLGEGSVADLLSSFQSEYPQVSIGSYPTFSAGGFGLHVVLRSADEVLMSELFDKLFAVLSDMGGNPSE